MWIFYSYYKGSVHLWGRERGLSRVSIAYPPSFYMHLKDPPAHREMIEALESRFKAETSFFCWQCPHWHIVNRPLIAGLSAVLIWKILTHTIRPSTAALIITIRENTRRQ